MPFALSVDVTGEQHARAKSRSLLRRISQRRAVLDVVADVTGRRNTSREIGGRQGRLKEMGVHVPESRQQILATDVDDSCVGRKPDRRARTRNDDPIALNHYRRIWNSGLSRHIDKSAA